MLESVLQGTTPIIKINMPEGVEVGSISNLLITMSQGRICLKMGINDVLFDRENNAVKVKLSESETLSFSATVVNVQMRYKLEDDDTIYGMESIPFRIIPIDDSGKFDEQKDGLDLYIRERVNTEITDVVKDTVSNMDYVTEEEVKELFEENNNPEKEIDSDKKTDDEDNISDSSVG